MLSRKSQLTNKELIVLLSGLLVFVALLVLISRTYVPDEIAYLYNVRYIEKYGLSKEYLIRHYGSAGPLYSVIHWILEPVTQLRVSFIRLVNIFFLLGSIYFISRLLRVFQVSPIFAFTTLAIPMTYVISGLALTEMPAIFFFSIGIFLIIKTTTVNPPYPIAILQLLTGGICISLAILGRQPYLLTLGALPILFFNNKKFEYRSILLLLTLVASLALPTFVFLIWNGLVAPYDSTYYYDKIAQKGIFFRPDFFLLCLAYFAIILFIIAPAFFLKPQKKEIISLGFIYIILIVVNYKFQLIPLLPLKSLSIKFVPSEYLDLVYAFFSAFFELIGIFFLITLYQQLRKNIFQRELLFFSVAALLIALSCMKITFQFSSRYAAQATPLLIPICSFFYKRYSSNFYRMAAGVIIGLIAYTFYIM
ncbi:MAG: hypothetical protein ICV65_19215 [Flavisolibacter sp.]|nr:hypothetical protein [Flavisolibacter sp.]